MRIILLFIITLLQKLPVGAQDTIRITRPIPIATLDTSHTLASHQLTGKNILFPFTPCNSPFNYLKVNDARPIQFLNSFIYLYGPSLPRTHEKILNNRVEFNTCYLKYLNLAALSGPVLIYNSRIGVVSIDSTYGAELQINSSDIRNVIHIENGVNLTFDCQNTSFVDTAFVLIYRSTISAFRLMPDSKSGSDFRFWEDTLRKSFMTYAQINNTPIKKGIPALANHFEFENCYIDADFFFFEEIPNSVFYFQNCTFGPNANLSAIPTKRAMFRHCKFLGNDPVIGIYSNSDTCYISFVNSKIDDIRINFTPHMRLWFDSTDSPDLIESSYARLIEKFKTEGKIASLKAIDIQHQEYSQSKLYNIVNKLWWNYGYNKWRVIGWTAVFIVFFFFLNSLIWKTMQETYPIVPYRTVEYFMIKTRPIFLNKLALSFLFTILVFFSLRIDLAKLSFKRLFFAFLFLFQYALGLWCLFFIARAIFTF